LITGEKHFGKSIMEYLNDSLLPLLGNLQEHITFLADYSNIKDPDLLGQIQNTWNNFVKTGQIWALLIGVVVGYMFKGLTSYG
jgi:hypothetical protein